MHDLRHAWATFLLSQGIEARTVTEVLGHSTTRLLDVYGHALPERLTAAASVVDELLSMPSGAALPTTSPTRRPRAPSDDHE
jgi:integrase